MPTRLRPVVTDTAIAGQPVVPAFPSSAPPVSGGLAGPTGLSAYQLALANGFVGTEAQWLASLVGAPTDPGDITLIFDNGLI
jgi:hypothetical protein